MAPPTTAKSTATVTKGQKLRCLASTATTASALPKPKLCAVKAGSPKSQEGSPKRKLQKDFDMAAFTPATRSVASTSTPSPPATPTHSRLQKEEEILSAIMKLDEAAQKRLAAAIAKLLASQVTVTKPADKPLGVTCDVGTMALVEVAPGSCADTCGVTSYLGWVLTHANGTAITTVSELRGIAKGLTAVTLRFAPPAASTAPTTPNASAAAVLAVGHHTRTTSFDDEWIAKSCRSETDSPEALTAAACTEAPPSPHPNCLAVGQHILSNFGINPDDLKVNYNVVLGTGSFGKVFLGDYQATEVAVKMQRSEKTLTDDEIDEWKKEVKIMTRLRHPNILMLLGACFETQNLMIVTELCAQGSLRKVLRKSRDIPWKTKLDWCIQIAKGMAFLHYKNIYHRDLKPSNVFVSGTNLKIADFGLSKIKVSTNKAPQTAVDLRDSFSLLTQLYTPTKCARNPVTGERELSGSEASIPGTFAFIAPEVWAEETFTNAADVYSFGVTMVEIISTRVPFDKDNASDCSWRIMTGRTRPVAPHTINKQRIPSSLRKIVSSCVAFLAEERPQFTELVAVLKKEECADYSETIAPHPAEDEEFDLERSSLPHPKCARW